MRPAALVFLLVLGASAAAWGLAVLPLHRKSADLAARIATEDIRGRAAAAADPAPSAEEARRLGEALAASFPWTRIPPPNGMAEGSAGTFAGRIPWEEVQDLLAWAAEQARPVLEVEVRALPEDPSRASCRVVLGQ